jgi:nucleoside phosphorylase
LEAYAMATTCLSKHVDLICYKFISDNANAGASLDWAENVNKEKLFFKEKILRGFY